jgi:hypothetical protein
LLDNFFSGRDLSSREESLYEFTFAANSHSGKSLEPLPFWNVRLAVQPIGERSELISGNPALLYSLEQMIEQRRRGFAAES